jgi:hypothetical protein
MKISIDFSIFDSPTHAYGNVTGEIDIPHSPRVGEKVALLDKQLTIISLTDVLNGNGGCVVGLEDIVLESKIEAENLAKRMDVELGLFCVAYDEF